jgi:hypothetical protein
MKPLEEGDAVLTEAGEPAHVKFLDVGSPGLCVLLMDDQYMPGGEQAMRIAEIASLTKVEDE